MLSVVKGGAGDVPPRSSDELRAKLRELRRIEAVVRSARAKPKSGPRQTMALIWSMFALGGGLALGGVCTEVLQLKQLHVAILLGVPFVAAIAAAIYVRATSKLPYTWAEHIDAQLAQYEPVDQAAYISLQKETAETSGFMAGNFSCWYEKFEDWVATETLSIHKLAGFIKPSKFLEKKV